MARSLERLTWAGQVVVVDSGSTDETRAIAGRFANVRVVHRPFDSHAEQWRFAPETSAYQIGFAYCIAGKPLRASLYPSLPVLFRRGKGAFVADGHTEKLRIDGPVVPLANRLLHDDRTSLERWLQSQSRYQAIEAEKLIARPWSGLGWADRLRRTRVLGPLAVAVHCPLVKGLMFDGTAGLHYTAQRVTADLILSMHLLQRDLDRVLGNK